MLRGCGTFPRPPNWPGQAGAVWRCRVARAPALQACGFECGAVNGSKGTCHAHEAGGAGSGPVIPLAPAVPSTFHCCPKGMGRVNTPMRTKVCRAATSMCSAAAQRAWPRARNGQWRGCRNPCRRQWPGKQTHKAFTRQSHRRLQGRFFPAPHRAHAEPGAGKGCRGNGSFRDNGCRGLRSSKGRPGRSSFHGNPRMEPQRLWRSRTDRAFQGPSTAPKAAGTLRMPSRKPSKV